MVPDALSEIGLLNHLFENDAPEGFGLLVLHRSEGFAKLGVVDVLQVRELRLSRVSPARCLLVAVADIVLQPESLLQSLDSVHVQLEIRGFLGNAELGLVALLEKFLIALQVSVHFISYTFSLRQRNTISALAPLLLLARRR